MEYRGTLFEGERLNLSDNTFHDCTFKNCELIFDGRRSPTFNDNEFVDTVFVFTEEAARTLYFLSNIYHAGIGGADVVERMLTKVLQGEMHGRSICTQLPKTEDHSLH